MIKLVLFILVVHSQSIFARQTCVIHPKTPCCQVAFSGVGGTAYAWRWVMKKTDGVTVTLDSVRSDSSRVGAPNQWQFNVCVSQMQQEPLVLKFQYESQGNIVNREEVEVING